MDLGLYGLDYNKHSLNRAVQSGEDRSIPENVISDGWVTKERISQKLLFWWHDWEVLVFSRESFEYLMF